MFGPGRVFMSCRRAFSTGTMDPLYGTVAPHSSYIFLHASKPPQEFPAKVSTPVQRALQLKALKWGGIVNFAWTGQSPKFADEVTPVTAFSPLGGRLEIPELSLQNLDAVEARLRNHAQLGPITSQTGDEVHLYICTHGARDCRCGETGGQVARALQEEVERRNLGNQVKVREVGHVGGHKYAANVLVFPHGEWLGLLRTHDVPAVLDAILQQPVRPFTHQDPPLLSDHWRGRTGLGKDDQISLYQHFQSINRNKDL